MTVSIPPRLHHQRGCSCPSCDYWRRADADKGRASANASGKLVPDAIRDSLLDRARLVTDRSNELSKIADSMRRLHMDPLADELRTIAEELLEAASQQRAILGK